MPKSMAWNLPLMRNSPSSGPILQGHACSRNGSVKQGAAPISARPHQSAHGEHKGDKEDHEKDHEHEDQGAAGVVRHVARIARVFSLASHGCVPGVTAGTMPVWYAAIDVFGSGTNCGCTAVVVLSAPGESCIGAGCTGCVGVDGGVGGTGCVCEAIRSMSPCMPCSSVLICVCCVDEGALSAPVTPRSPAARMNIDEANAVSILPRYKSRPPAMASTTATTIAPISVNGLLFIIPPYEISDTAEID